MRGYASSQFPIDPTDQQTILNHAIEADHIILQFFAGNSSNPPKNWHENPVTYQDIKEFYIDALSEWIPDEQKSFAESDVTQSFKFNITEHNYTNFPDIHTILTQFLVAWKCATITFADGDEKRGDAIIYRRKNNIPPHPDSSVIQDPRSEHPDSVESRNERLEDEKREEMIEKWYTFHEKSDQAPYQYKPVAVIYGNDNVYGMDTVLYAIREFGYTDVTVSPTHPHPQLAFTFDPEFGKVKREASLEQGRDRNLESFRAEHYPRIQTDNPDEAGRLQRRLERIDAYPPEHVHNPSTEWINP